jgi:Flp pilus assembly protein TadG
MKRMQQRRRSLRRGAITVLMAILSVVLIGMVAFCVDIGYVLTAKEELQRTADAAALAAGWEFGQKVADGLSGAEAAQLARLAAVQYASLNYVTGKPVQLDSNPTNAPDGGVVFGYLPDMTGDMSKFQTTDPTLFNAVRVRTQKDSSYNGEVPYFFAKIFGVDGQMLHTEAVAVIVRDIRGFQTPPGGGNVQLLPFALDAESWDNLLNGNGDDHWRWNPDTKRSEWGSDGLCEVNLYPQATGAPGNRGTVDIGNPNNSTHDLARQIVHGVSPQDLAHHGGKLEFDSSGKLCLNGDTGISAGMKDELAQIIGKPRVIPVFTQVEGPGNNAEYTINRWGGIRIMDVNLTGPMSRKHVTIQGAPIAPNGVIPSSTNGTSDFIYSSVVLVK